MDRVSCFLFPVFCFPSKYCAFFYSKQKTENRKLSFQGFGLINEHDGDVVLDFVDQAAGLADEAVTLVIQPDVPLALGTGQDFQEFFADGHDSSKIGWGNLSQIPPHLRPGQLFQYNAYYQLIPALDKIFSHAASTIAG
jgi:hypothetical protein